MAVPGECQRLSFHLRHDDTTRCSARVALRPPSSTDLVQLADASKYDPRRTKIQDPPQLPHPAHEDAVTEKLNVTVKATAGEWHPRDLVVLS